ncbi:MAG TPA: GNAT family N-acetyltransferase [Puia sp.]|nr:GNAT family N-acetyltransferase [Puia sp.]
MDEPVSIRPADLDDINTIGFLAQQTWPDTYGKILSSEQLRYMMQLFYSPTSLRRQMVDEHHRFIIVEQGEEAIGFASWAKVHGEPKVVKLHKIYFLPRQQGKGLGRSVLQFVFGEIRPEGARTLRLNVNRFNKAREFYERIGFTVIKEEDVPIGNGYFMNDYVMEMAVPGAV